MSWFTTKGGLFFILGIITLSFSLTSHPAIPESKLKLLEGVPTELKLTESSRNGQSLDFDLGDLHLDYAERKPHYGEMRAILMTGEPVKVWVETEGYNNKYGKIYKMTFEDAPVVTYAESVKSQSESKTYATIASCVFLAIGLVSLFMRMRR